MSYSTTINKEIMVNSVYFGNNGNKLKSYPKQIVCDGKTYTFIDGLQLLVNKGNNMFKIFCMNDETSCYRIMQDVSSNIWTLKTIANR